MTTEKNMNDFSRVLNCFPKFLFLTATELKKSFYRPKNEGREKEKEMKKNIFFFPPCTFFFSKFFNYSSYSLFLIATATKRNLLAKK
jgi:hypothetical protein